MNAPIIGATVPSPRNPTPSTILWCINGNKHCLHKSDQIHNRQVAGGLHIDQICCWCGAEGCRDALAIIRRGHGQFGPTSKIRKKYANDAARVLAIYNRASTRLTPLAFDANEIDMARLFWAGLSNKEIQDALKMTIDQFRKKLKTTRRRLKARTTVQAFMMIAKSVSL